MDIKLSTIMFFTHMPVFFLIYSEIDCVFASNHVVKCKDKEREALLTFKQGLTDGYGVLSSWGSEECCCNWDGVVCSKRTGHVISLELGTDGLGGELSSALLDLRHLSHLDLSGNDFGGIKIPEFIGSLHKLKYLNLWWSNFTGDLPSWLGNLTNLIELDLGQNNLTSKHLTWVSNLTSLSTLQLSNNHFEGTLSWLSNLTSLSLLDLSWNSFTGTIPDLTASSSLLTQLYLRDNDLTGHLPTSIGQLSNLESLDVSHNSLQGTISELHFSKLGNLKLLRLSSNSLTLNFSPEWVPPFQLSGIYLAGCNVGPRFPTWLQTQRNFSWLDLSFTGISDEVPIWFWDLSRISNLNLSHNQISGPVPDLSLKSAGFAEIDVSFNNFSGPLPTFHPNCSVIHLYLNKFSGSIQSICKVNYAFLHLLDLSNNQFSGELPSCWERMTTLTVLDLADNNFSGHLPHTLGSLYLLETLHLRNNNLTGELPSTLKNCTKLQMIDVGGNELTGSVPTWMGMLTDLVFLILRHNNFDGSIPPEICHLQHIQILDLSWNNIRGRVPQCFGNLTSLVLTNRSTENYQGFYTEHSVVQWKRQESQYWNPLGFFKLIDLSSNKLVGNIPPGISLLAELNSLNLSQNYLTGTISSDIDHMKMLESLDLSRNSLSGEIPNGLARLHFLALLDLSNNNFSGKIPTGTQLQSFNPSVYAGNKNLCGDPLPNCPGDDPRPSAANTGKQEDVDGQIDEHFNLIQSLIEDYFISAVLGYVVGFWVIIGPLLFKRSWRTTYFVYLSKIGDWLYVPVNRCTTRL